MPLSSIELTKSLEPLKALLRHLKQQIGDQDKINKFAGYSSTERELEIAYSWIFADAEYYSLMGREFPRGNEYLESSPQSPVEDNKALFYYGKFIKNISQDAYLTEIFDYKICPPGSNESLRDYLVRLSINFRYEEKFKSRTFRWLIAFLAFLRDFLPFDQSGFIGLIFPQSANILYAIPDQKPKEPQSHTKRIWFSKSIDRSVLPEVRLIGKILEGLSKRILLGKINGSLAAVEALALCWTCLTFARRNSPGDVNQIYQSPIFIKDFSYILPTMNGSAKVPISSTLSKYLIFIATLSPKPFFQTSLRNLSKSLSSVRNDVLKAFELPGISFSQFLTMPIETANTLNS